MNKMSVLNINIMAKHNKKRSGHEHVPIELGTTGSYSEFRSRWTRVVCMDVPWFVSFYVVGGGNCRRRQITGYHDHRISSCYKYSDTKPDFILYSFSIPSIPLYLSTLKCIKECIANCHL